MLQKLLQNIWKTKYAKSNYQTNTQHFSNPEYIFKSAKSSLEKRNPVENSKTIICKVLSKISNRKKTSKQQYNFYKEEKTSLEVYGM